MLHVRRCIWLEGSFAGEWDRSQSLVLCSQVGVNLGWRPSSRGGWGEIVMGFEDKAKKFVLDVVKKGKGFHRR